jgi:hypothetical protein
MAARKSGPFKGLFDFCERVDLKRVNRKGLECFIKAGSFDFAKVERRRLFESIDRALERGQSRDPQVLHLRGRPTVLPGRQRGRSGPASGRRYWPATLFPVRHGDHSGGVPWAERSVGCEGRFGAPGLERSRQKAPKRLSAPAMCVRSHWTARSLASITSAVVGPVASSSLCSLENSCANC